MSGITSKYILDYDSKTQNTFTWKIEDTTLSLSEIRNLIEIYSLFLKE